MKIKLGLKLEESASLFWRAMKKKKTVKAEVCDNMYFKKSRIDSFVTCKNIYTRGAEERRGEYCLVYCVLTVRDVFSSLT